MTQVAIPLLLSLNEAVHNSGVATAGVAQRHQQHCHTYCGPHRTFECNDCACNGLLSSIEDNDDNDDDDDRASNSSTTEYSSGGSNGAILMDVSVPSSPVMHQLTELIGCGNNAAPFLSPSPLSLVGRQEHSQCDGNNGHAITTDGGHRRRTRNWLPAHLHFDTLDGVKMQHRSDTFSLEEDDDEEDLGRDARRKYRSPANTSPLFEFKETTTVVSTPQQQQQAEAVQEEEYDNNNLRCLAPHVWVTHEDAYAFEEAMQSSRDWCHHACDVHGNDSCPCDNPPQVRWRATCPQHNNCSHSTDDTTTKPQQYQPLATMPTTSDNKTDASINSNNDDAAKIPSLLICKYHTPYADCCVFRSTLDRPMYAHVAFGFLTHQLHRARLNQQVSSSQRGWTRHVSPHPVSLPVVYPSLPQPLLMDGNKYDDVAVSSTPLGLQWARQFGTFFIPLFVEHPIAQCLKKWPHHCYAPMDTNTGLKGVTSVAAHSSADDFWMSTLGVLEGGMRLALGYLDMGGRTFVPTTTDFQPLTYDNSEDVNKGAAAPWTSPCSCTSHEREALVLQAEELDDHRLPSGSVIQLIVDCKQTPRRICMVRSLKVDKFKSSTSSTLSSSSSLTHYRMCAMGNMADLKMCLYNSYRRQMHRFLSTAPPPPTSDSSSSTSCH